MIRLIEVGPRDGLQNRAEIVTVAAKLKFIEALAQAGYPEIEATAFVSPRWVPQLADAEEVSHQLRPHDGLIYSALVPNRKGLRRAIECGYQRVAVFTAASEAFSQKNTNRSIADSLAEFKPLVQEALQAKVRVRGYLSTAWWCPYSGKIDAKIVASLTHQMLELGIDEISLGDTVGLAVPSEVEATLQDLEVYRSQIALHFHDTSGTALANVLRAYQLGFTTFDCSAGGLGGCPYAPGASGNLASEDVIYMFEQMGIPTGVDLDKVAQASNELSQYLKCKLPGRTLARLLAAWQPDGR